jgi:putative methyltransferase (TIGR04325 family)
MSFLTRTLWAAKSFPPMRAWRERRMKAYFLSEAGFGQSYGLYPDFAAARAAVPPSTGYDNEHLAEEFIPRLDKTFGYDYPVMFWLSRAFAQGARSVFDIGGAVGVHFFAYQKFLPYPAGLTWRVCETPGMAHAGRKVAEGRPSSGLTFVESVDAPEGDADVWLSAGTFQYIENGRPGQLLARRTKRPAHLIFTKLPVSDGEGLITCQNIGKDAYSPFQVFARAQFVAEVEALGYRLVDAWSVPERGFFLLGHPEATVGKFSGFYFALKS